MNTHITVNHPAFEELYAARWRKSEERDRKIRARRGFEPNPTRAFTESLTAHEKAKLIEAVMREQGNRPLTINDLVTALAATKWVHVEAEGLRARLEKGVKEGWFVHGPILPNPKPGAALKSYLLPASIYAGG